MAPFKETQKEQVLVRMWRNWNPCASQVGMLCGTADMKNSIMVPQKTENRATISASNHSTRDILQGNEMSMAKRRPCAYANCSTNAVVKMWKQPKCPWANEWLQNCGVYTDNGMLFSLHKGRRSCHSQQHGWTVRTLCHEKQAGQKQKLHDFTDMLNLKKLSTEE